MMQAYGGLMSVNGHPGGEPARVGTSIVAMGTGMWAALGIVAALRQREATGRAVEVTTALFETALMWISYQAMGYFGSGEVPQPQGSGTAMIVPYQAFPTADGYAMIAAASDVLFQRLCHALGAAHRAGIVHRDLKPENVFLVGGAADRGTDDVRVVDFGAAKVLGSSRLTKTGIVFGTPHYMSPEQASGAAVDHRADIYALGIMMYEMFTGRVPFEADTYMGVLTQHMFVNPVPPSQVSPAARELGALEQITLRCLEKKPDDRYADTGELVKAIDAVVEFDQGGRMSVAPRLDEGAPPRQSRVPPRFRMADELEPPTLEEMRAAVDAAPELPLSSPWKWIALAAGVIALASTVLVVTRKTGPASVASSAPRASIPSTIVTPSIPPPPPATSVAVTDTPDAAPPKPEVKRPPVAVAPPKPASAPTPTRAPAAKCDPDDPFCKR
jgi:serine/threonine-protein kinase